ncbi:MAG TPA: hypothetical protein VGC36_05605, partial [Rhizomicrobium sp.]
ASSSPLSSLGNGSYTFRGRACSGASCSNYATRAFSVSLISPTSAPSVTSPSQGALLDESVQTFAWTQVSAGGGLPIFYEVELTNLNINTTELRISVPDPTLSTIGRVHNAS